MGLGDDRTSRTDRERIDTLAERVHYATGCSNLVELALAPDRLSAVVGEDVARAITLRLGLDRLADGRPLAARPSGEVADALGMEPDAVERLIDDGLAAAR